MSTYISIGRQWNDDFAGLFFCESISRVMLEVMVFEMLASSMPKL